MAPRPTMPQISSVQRTGPREAYVHFAVQSGWVAVQVSVANRGQTPGSTSQANQVTMPATSVRLPLPHETNLYDARLQAVAAGGVVSGWTGPSAVPVWWVSPAAVTNLAAARTSADRSKVALTWAHGGTGGSAATSYRIEHAAVGGTSWSTLTTVTARSHTATLALTASRRYRVTAINPAGASSPVEITVGSWWQPVAPASALTGTRTSAGQIQLGWTVTGAGAQNPVRSIKVQRAPFNSGDYKTVATLPASARTWTDTSTSITSQYRYRIVTVGDMGDASSQPTISVATGMTSPAAPSSVSVARDTANPDTLRVSFSTGGGAGNPTTDVRLLAVEGGKEVAATGWVKASTANGLLVHAAGPNRVLAYSVEARNAAGTARSPLTAEWATTPRGVATFTASRAGGDVLLAWTVSGATIATGWEIERSPDGGVNRFPLPAVSGGGTRSAVHSSASFDVDHAYWIRPTRTAAPDAPWVRVQAPVPAGARPNAPLLTEPGWAAAGEPVVVEWTHRSVDGTPQAEARIEWQLEGGGPVTTVTVAGDVSSATLLAVAELQDHGYVWRAQTRGTGSGLWSEWSGWSYRQIAERPTLDLEVPATVTSQVLHGDLTVDAGWVSATVTLLDTDGVTVATRQLTPQTGTGFAFAVQDRQTYTVTASVHDGRLESAPQTRTVTVEWARPAAPSLTATAIDEMVRLDADLPEGAFRVELIRVTDGTEHSLGDTTNNVAWDMWPRFCAPERYIARAWAESGAWQDSEPMEVIVHQRDLVIAYGPGLSQRVTAGPRGLTTAGGTVEKAVRQYVGRRYPTVYTGGTRSPHVVSVQATLWEHHSALAEWVDAHNAGGEVLLRDPSGLAILGTLDVAARDHEHRYKRGIQFTVTETGARP